MGRWVIALIAVAAFVAVPSATPQVVVAQTVFHTADLPSSAITGFNVTCLPGYVAVSGGVSSAAPGATTLSIRTLGVRTYAFRFGNPATNPHQRVTVAVSCRRIRVRAGTSPYLKVKPVKLRPVTVKPASQKAASLRCPPGTVPAGSGFELNPARSKAVARFSGTTLSIRRQTETLHGVSFILRNSGSQARAVGLYATCLTVVRPPGASSERLLVKILTDTTPVHPGTQAVKHACPRGWTALATGFALPGSIAMDGSAAIGRAAKWSLTNRAASTALADLQLLCGRLSA
jgi:hypothetical protein